MRKVRYNCAMSLDGYIADADDGFDWIELDPDIDFEELSSQFDTYLMGRRTFEAAGGQGPPSSEIRNYVFSTTLDQSDHANLRIISADWVQAVRALRAEPGKDIWLFGVFAMKGWLTRLRCPSFPSCLVAAYPWLRACRGR